MNRQVDIPKDKIVDFCLRWRIVEFAIFGSTLREDFRPSSDIDVLVTFEAGVHWGFPQWLEMTRELEALFGRRVDLVERRLVEQSKNYIRRKHILSHLEQIYVAR